MKRSLKILLALLGSIVLIPMTSCSVKLKQINGSNTSSIERIEQIRNSIETGDWVAFTTNNVHYRELKVVAVGDRSMVVARPRRLDKSQTCRVIEFSDIQDMTVESIKISDKGGFIVITLLVLFYLMA